MNLPHESYYNNIVNRYGAVWLNKVKEFTRLRNKRKRLECGLKFLVQCRDNNVVPKFAQIKPIKCIRDYEEFFSVASKKLLCRAISDYRRKYMCVSQCVYDLHLQLSRYLDEDMWNVLDTMTHSRVENMGMHTSKRQEHKLANLINRNKIYPHKSVKVTQSVSSAVTVVNLSSKELSEDALSVLSRGLNFAPTPRRIPVEEIISSIENTVFRNKIPHGDAECLRQDVSALVRKSSLPKSNITRKEVSAVRDLRNDESLLVLPADKGNATVVVDTEAYENKITQMVGDTSVYKKVSYNPTSRVTSKVNKLLHNTGDKELVAQLRPLNPTPPKIYGLPKIHKPNWPLRPIVSQIDAPTYKLSRHLATTLQPHTGKTSSYVRDSRHFVTLLEDVQLQETELMVSFDITSLFTNVPVDEVLDIISTLLGGTTLPTGYIESLRYCLKSGYFLWRGEFFLQIDGVAMGSPLAPVVANIFMEWFEQKALGSTDIKPRYWWRYVDDIFAIVDRDALQDLTTHLNRVHSKIQVTTEKEKDGKLPFLDVLVIREPNGRVTHTVYRKPTHTDRYLRADSHHHHTHLSSVPRTLLNRALALCDPKYLDAEIGHVRDVLERNGYQWRRCRRLLGRANECRKRPAEAERTPAYLPYVQGVTDKIGRLLRRRYSIKTIYRPPGQLRQWVRSPKDKDPLGVPGVYKIPCDCGLCYIGETRRNVATRLGEHIRSMKSLDTEKSAVAEHICNAGTAHYIRFDKASVLAKEKYFVPRKVREAIEISRHPNFNRDCGWTLPPAWKPALRTTTRHTKPSLECDAVSTVCTNSTSTVARTMLMTTAGAPPAPPATSAPLSARARRYAARCAAADVSSTRDSTAASAHD